MSDMKCPFCQQELEIWHTNRVRMYACPDLTCKGYYMSATKDMWQELIRTRKALEKAVDALDTVRQYYRKTAVVRPHNIAAYCDNKIDKIKEITVLEQIKDNDKE